MSEARHLVGDRSSTQRDLGLERAQPFVPDREYNWPLYAVLSGLAGASVVAIVFLIVDLASGRPALWTPAVLGSALFLGETIARGPEFAPLDRIGVVFAYTLMHGVVFVGFGAMAASERLTRRHVRGMQGGPAALTALLLFLGLEVMLGLLGWLVGPDLDLAARLGSGWIAVANALAAIAMTATIVHGARRLRDERHHGQHGAGQEAEA